MRGGAFIALLGALVATCIAAPVFAATLDIPGPYGNETGCKVLAGGEYTSDDKLILRPDSVEAHESGCEFVEVLPSKDGGAVITGYCQGEGSLWTRQYVVSPPDPENGNKRQIFFDDGELWAEVGPCG